MLLDFWTYSCINCLRTLPHLESWYSAYHRYGLVIIGVHSPEFAFEHVASNVAAAIKRLGITYPVVQDNDFATWTNYSNEYWPADYLIDQQGRIRAYDTGEGDYADMEQNIARAARRRNARAAVPDLTPTEQTTPESYLGYARLDPTRYVRRHRSRRTSRRTTRRPSGAARTRSPTRGVARRANDASPGKQRRAHAPLPGRRTSTSCSAAAAR